ncbi:MAG: NADH-quinone oxidoreductase subunit L, partial [Marivirga sp.]|nr:NADH-quinone oxidoreductase subunit L [Marivirga sp.]
ITSVISLSGVYLAYYFYLKKPDLSHQVKSSIPALHHIWFTGWGLDALYNALFVKPFVFFAVINKKDIVDKFYSLIVSSTDFLHRVFAKTQSGILRWYVLGVVIGAILIMTLGLLL